MQTSVNLMDNYIFRCKINGNDAKEYLHNGDTFIEGRNKSEFELYFRNNHSYKVKVVFSVDGLSVMDGKVASDKSFGYIVNAWDSITVPGWRINSGKVAKFVFRPQGEKNNGTYVEELKAEGFDVDAGNQGVIGCMVFKEEDREVYTKTVYRDIYHYPHPLHPWNLQPKIMYTSTPNYYGAQGIGPTSESWSATASGMISGGCAASNMQCMNMMTPNSFDEPIVAVSNAPSLGAGFGDDANFATRNVKFEAESSPDWVGVIHYDTIINLRKRGVFIEEKKPEAFPGYKDGCYVPKNR